MRPFGGWLFGHFADRHGRRLALTVSVLMMCAGSLIIAVTPTYATIGLAAPFVLLFARLVQGLSLGGEYGTSATYLCEVAHPRAPRLLFELPVRDADRRPAARHARAAVPAEAAADAGADRRVGLAHPVLHRRRARRRRLLHAPRHARERRVPRSARAGRAGEPAAGADAAPARGGHRRRPDARRHRRLLHLHDVHAEVPRQLGRAVEGHVHRHRGRDAVPLHVPAAGGRRLLRPRRAAPGAADLRRARHAAHRADPHRPAERRRTRGPRSS